MTRRRSSQRPDRGTRPSGSQAGEPPDDFAAWKTGYADAMGGVHARHPDDLDVAALYADAMMNLTAWQLGGGDRRAGGGRPDARDPARAGGRRWRCRAGDEHPGRVLHLQIHLMEMSAHPERALSARRTPCARSSPAPGTCCTCRRTSTCCAATTRARSRGTCARSRPTRRTRRARAGSASTRSITRTTATSGSTGRCSRPGAGRAGRRGRSRPAARALLRTEQPPMAD